MTDLAAEMLQRCRVFMGFDERHGGGGEPRRGMRLLGLELQTARGVAAVLGRTRDRAEDVFLARSACRASRTPLNGAPLSPARIQAHGRR